MDSSFSPWTVLLVSEQLAQRNLTQQTTQVKVSEKGYIQKEIITETMGEQIMQNTESTIRVTGIIPRSFPASGTNSLKQDSLPSLATYNYF